MNRDHIEKHVRNQISKFNIPFDIEEAQKSNILISGTNHTGKSRLACNITSILQNFNWKVICFDNTGIWRKISDLPTWYQVTEQNIDLVYETVNYPFPNSSIIYDTSLLIPDHQKLFVDKVLRDLWDTRVNNPSSQWTLVALEEAQLSMRNIRGSVGQNLLRIASAGRNLNVRILAITVDLALIDPSFIRLCQQRYHARLAIEDNSKRKFRGYYGGDWCRVAQELDLGFFIYLFKNKLKIVHVPLFEPKRLPTPYTQPIIESLVEMGGSGRMPNVLDKVYNKIKDRLRQKDFEMLSSGTAIRWKNRAQWERQRLKSEGYLKKDSPRGTWEITDDGRKLYERLKQRK